MKYFILICVTLLSFASAEDITTEQAREIICNDAEVSTTFYRKKFLNFAGKHNEMEITRNRKLLTEYRAYKELLIEAELIEYISCNDSSNISLSEVYEIIKQ